VLTQQLLYAKVIFTAQFSELHTNAFQGFFQTLMQYRNPSFLPVRPHGRMGDQGSDGLCVNGHKLYACYAPQSPNDAETTSKFRSDLASALRQRPGQFSTFVFVHNDRLGMHPRIASEIVRARAQHPGITFEQMGKIAIWREFMRLELFEAEDMLGQEIKVEELVYGIGLADLEPLLSHLGRTRGDRQWVLAHAIPQRKIEFNEFGADVREFLIHGLRFVRQVADYYELYKDILVRDETAAAFRERYQELQSADLSPDEIFQELFVYVAGNRLPDPATLTSVYTILSYFFQSCDIFEEPPSDFALSPGGEP
jgi:hypothetical protein